MCTVIYLFSFALFIPKLLIYTGDDVTYVYDDMTYVYDDVTYVYCYLSILIRIVYPKVIDAHL